MVSEISLERCQLAHRAAGMLRWQAQPTAAQTMYRWALRGFEKALGLDGELTLMAVHSLGLICREQGNLEEAEIMFTRALQGTEQALGPTHPSTILAVANLGRVYRDRGKLQEAEKMFLWALRGYEKAQKPDSSPMLEIAYGLLDVYQRQGKVEHADKMPLRVLQVKEKVWAEDAQIPETAEGFTRALASSTDYDIGVQYVKLSRISDMIPLVSKRTSKRNVLLGYLGTILLRAGDDSNAQIAFQRALIVPNSGRVSAYAGCDRCGCCLTLATGHAVCRRYYDTDPCTGCLIKHLAGVRELSTRVGHPFFAVALDDHTSLTEEKEITLWLRRLAMRYPRQQEEDSEHPGA